MDMKPLNDAMVTPDFSGVTTDEEFMQRYYEANPWAKPDASEDKPTED